MKKIHPLTAVNYFCLAFFCVSQIFTFRQVPAAGVLVAAVFGTIIFHAIQTQADAATKPKSAKSARVTAIIIKVVFCPFEYYTLSVALARTTILTLSGEFWAFLTAVLLTTADIRNFIVRAEEARETAEAERQRAEAERAEATNQNRRADQRAEAEAERQHQIELRKLDLAAKVEVKQKAQETAQKLAEEARRTEETRQNTERTRMETEQKERERQQKAAENEKNRTEAAQKAREAKQNAEDEAKKAAAEKRRTEIESKRRADPDAHEAQKKIWREQAANRAAKKRLNQSPQLATQ